MASNIDDRLLNAAFEGFSSLEGRRNKRPNPAAGRPQTQSATNNHHQLPAITSKEAAQRYGGIVIEPVITSDKAAKRYGGIVIGPAVTSDMAVQRYGGVLITDRPTEKH
ncbi:hypothetical protein JCGZ_18917 [Jatropha curcas]|uniref:Uncharacterized protein n=1 Tax=Jatropha curcas TaxID=180498 RepID=A0A067JVC5_JATCU|nr:hypothetical protein JCGZ_18917 [Jatropha curcas]